MKLSDAPKGLRPFLFHGVELEWSDGDEEARGPCPFCDSPKFSVNIGTTKWGCFRCRKERETSGNSIGFIRQVWKISDEATKGYTTLQRDRGLLLADTLVHWEVAWSPIRREWVLAGRDYQNRVCQLYRYIQIEDKVRLLATPTLNHGIFGRQLYDASCSVVYLCEGPWDAMTLWEILKQAKETDKGYQRTGNLEASLLHDVSVLATPGCNVFRPEWSPLCADRDVIIIYDNDHPRPNPKTEQLIPPLGYEGVKRVALLLQGSPRPPTTVSYLCWGEGGYDPSLPSGFDLRDALEGDLASRLRAWQWVGARVTPVARMAVREDARATEGGLLPKACDSYQALITSWRKALKWGVGLDHALAAMLASIASVKTVGDQLWLKVVSPPSTGKTVLCEALATNRKYVKPISTFRGFHSGYRGEGESGNEDHGLIAELYDKTMVMKDGDTLLQTPNLTQILSEGRDLYDGASRSHYRNKKGRDYENVRMTWILCGTAALRKLDESELGERFLDVVIMDQVDPEYENPILVRVAHKAAQAVTMSTDGQESSKYNSEINEAMRLTGGYIDWLKEHGPDVLPQIEMSEESLMTCIRLGKFVAYMRARPSLRQIETAEREMAARLVSQLVRMAKCLALVLNRASVDEVVLERVHKVALDTSRGRVLNIVKELLERDEGEGMLPHSISLLINQSEMSTVTLLRFMRQIKILETYQRKQADSSVTKMRWRLTKEVEGLVRKVLGDEGSET